MLNFSPISNSIQPTSTTQAFWPQDRMSQNNTVNDQNTQINNNQIGKNPNEKVKNELPPLTLPGTPGGKDENRNGRIDAGEECQTCKNRKYQDGSDEMVSFKSATHVSPEAAASAVRAHEQEHVSNAYKKASSDNGKVINASVSIHTAVCPECGRTYVSGGTTHTQIKYYNEDNPYQKDLKSADRAKYGGMNADYSV